MIGIGSTFALDELLSEWYVGPSKIAKGRESKDYMEKRVQRNLRMKLQEVQLKGHR